MMALGGMILGVQLRVGVAELRSVWMDRDRRERFLLKPEVEIPKSADHAAWPSLRSPDLLSRLFRDHYGPNSAPNGLTLYQDLRTPLPEMAGVLVGIGFPEGRARRLCDRHCIMGPPEALSDVASRMTFLGYDVCDDWLVSGLCNCGLPAEAQREVRAELAGLLNEHGLFATVEPAERLALRMDREIPEHARFGPVLLSALL
jgi:hypothetical protein